MPKEIYLHTAIYPYVVEQTMVKMEEYKNEDIILRVSSPGGSVIAGWNLIAKMIEHKGKITIKVDGAAFSMAMDLLPYADEVIANDVSRFMFHRGNAPVSSQQDQDFLDKINADLRAKFEKKVSSEKFKEATGYTYDEVFASNKQIDIFLTAEQVRTMGLVDKIIPLDPKEASKFNESLFEIAAMAESNKQQDQDQNKTMTLEEIKAKYPALYEQILAQGASEGQKKERDRVTAWQAFAAVDPEGVIKAIKEGKEISMTDISEMTVKMNSPEKLKQLATSSAQTVTTTEVEKTETEKEDANKKFVEDSKKILKTNFVF
jgi:ATP-dependent Clp protease, protease subunit